MVGYLLPPWVQPREMAGGKSPPIVTGKVTAMNNLPPVFTGILHSYLRISEQQNPEKTVSDIKKELVEGEGDE